MKTHSLKWLLGCTISSLFLMLACSDDSGAVEENPFFSLLTLPGTKIDTIEKAAKVWEYGFKFTPLKQGVINKLGIKVPGTGSYKVKLYHLAPDSLIIEKEIESKSKNAEYYISIDDVQVLPQVEYGLSLVADAFFKVQKKDSSQIGFPQIIGNLKIVSYHEEACGSAGCSSFPSGTNSLVIAPCVTLVYTSNE